jgi:hypothetical protein
VNGTGKNMPVGITRDIHKGVAVTDGAYPMKQVQEHGIENITPLNAEAKFAPIMDYLSVKEVLNDGDKERPANIAGQVVALINPANYYGLMARLGDNKQPHGIRFVQSVAQTAGQMTAFVVNRYDAYRAGGVRLREYDQTLALEDMQLYTAKTFAYGKAKDDKAAGIWTLDLSNEVALPVTVVNAADFSAPTVA